MQPSPIREVRVRHAGQRVQTRFVEGFVIAVVFVISAGFRCGVDQGGAPCDGGGKQPASQDAAGDAEDAGIDGSSLPPSGCRER
jgi:hypothetical protein